MTAPPIFRVTYQVKAMSAAATTTDQNGTLYVIVPIVVWDTASQPALVAFANAPHHCVWELTIRLMIAVSTAVKIAQVSFEMFLIIVDDVHDMGSFLVTLHCLHLFFFQACPRWVTH